MLSWQVNCNVTLFCADQLCSTSVCLRTEYMVFGCGGCMEAAPPTPRGPGLTEPPFPLSASSVSHEAKGLHSE